MTTGKLWSQTFSSTFNHQSTKKCIHLNLLSWIEKMCTRRISWECARLGLCHSLWVGILKILEIETKSPIGRLVPSTNLDQRRLLPGAAIFELSCWRSCENITPSKKNQITKYIGKSSAAAIKEDTTDDERRWCQWRLKSPSEQLKQKVGIAEEWGKACCTH